MSGPLGPFSQEEFKALVEAPYGAARRAIQKHDPLWGREESEPGEKRDWRVNLTQMVMLSGVVTVEAETEEEAELLADAIPDSQINWNHKNTFSTEIDSVELLP